MAKMSQATFVTSDVLRELDRRIERAVKGRTFSPVEDVWARNLRRVLKRLLDESVVSDAPIAEEAAEESPDDD